jgi:uncharacterized protein
MNKVYFTTSRITKSKGLLQKFTGLMEHMAKDSINSGQIVCLKTHFGEDGNTGFISPLYIRKAADFVKKAKAYPVVGDTNTLYTGRRQIGPTHLELAIEHGFDYSVINAPIAILDGLKGKYEVTVDINRKHFQEVSLAGSLQDIDSMIVLSHFKGHMALGFGGAIKNLAMGLATRRQKQRMHSDVQPDFKKDKCIECRLCEEVCPVNAIDWSDGTFNLNLDLCIGCAECIVNCPTGALRILWNEKPLNISEKLAETALGAVQFMERKVIYFNFLLKITPDCDCLGRSDNSIVEDIGILGSYDPVAIDRASLDLVNKAPRTRDSVGHGKEGEIFKSIHKSSYPEHQLTYGEEIGLGTNDYELIRLDF